MPVLRLVWRRAERVGPLIDLDPSPTLWATWRLAGEVQPSALNHRTKHSFQYNHIPSIRDHSGQSPTVRLSFWCFREWRNPTRRIQERHLVQCWIVGILERDLHRTKRSEKLGPQSVHPRLYIWIRPCACNGNLEGTVGWRYMQQWGTYQSRHCLLVLSR